ncbi:MAG: ATP synthase F1 subunit delta [Clostridia bacterium]|nr:ATP synthase F1 subunit delta [Clostridia bacterium]
MNDVAKRYAKALMEASVDFAAIKQANTLLCDVPELFRTLKSPVIKKREKYAVIERIFDKGAVPFIKLLCDNCRIEMLDDICKAYGVLLLEKENTICAELLYAFLPTDEEIEKIKSTISKKYQKKYVSLKLHEDKSIIGGLVLKVGNVVYDRSIKGSIDALKRSIKVG